MVIQCIKNIFFFPFSSTSSAAFVMEAKAAIQLLTILGLFALWVIGSFYAPFDVS